MSNDKLLNVSNGYMLHCGIDCRKKLMERRSVVDYMYLDNHLKGTSRSQRRMRFVIDGG